MRSALIFAITLSASASVLPAQSADFSCENLVPSGHSLICAGFEPNWAVRLSCDGMTMSSTFIDAFSGDGIEETPGTVTFSSQSPWTFETSHPVKGTITSTPAGCTDESDRVFDLTFTPAAAPDLPGPFFPFCCRME